MDYWNMIEDLSDEELIATLKSEAELWLKNLENIDQLRNHVERVQIIGYTMFYRTAKRRKKKPLKQEGAYTRYKKTLGIP